jgi:ubiquinone/menaquinone biosynthesis C-methylase UbiE
MTNEVLNKLKDEYQKIEFSNNNIPNLINREYLKGDNEKYMKMYDWMARGYDFMETVWGKLFHGNQVNQMRREMMNKLEWKNNISILYVSIGTGKDLDFIPQTIDLKSLTICGIDISLGMLKKCKKKRNKKLNLSLLQCCAEDLPFRDNSFDMVFHVGGINFFNDIPKAINEMIRVAKEGTKLLIADDTNYLIEKQYKKNIFTRKYYKDKTLNLNEIEEFIPLTVKERQTNILWDEKFYCITFRK